MRIAFLLDSFPNALGNFISSQISGLIDRNHSVDIYAQVKIKGVTPHSEVIKYRMLDRVRFPPDLPANPALRLAKGLGAIIKHRKFSLLRTLNFKEFGHEAYSLRLLYSSLPFCDSRPYDILHAHYGPVGLDTMRLRDLGMIRGKIITTFYGYDISRLIRENRPSYYERLFEETDGFVSICDHFTKRLQTLGCPSEKIFLNRLGVDLENFAYSAPRRFRDGPIRILSVCRLVEKKGIEYAIRAVAKLVNEDFPVEYRILGDGELERPLKELAAQLGVSDKIYFLGAQPHDVTAAEIRECDLLIAPSVVSNQGDEEGTPVAISEAMASGRAVLGTFHAGIPELISDGKSGFLVPERDYDALAEKILYFAHHPERWEAMGREGRQWTEKHQNTSYLNDRLEEIYSAVLAAKSSAKFFR